MTTEARITSPKTCIPSSDTRIASPNTHIPSSNSRITSSIPRIVSSNSLPKLVSLQTTHLMLTCPYYNFVVAAFTLSNGFGCSRIYTTFSMF